MNPDEKTTPETPPTGGGTSIPVTTPSSTPEVSSPEADAAAFQVIEALEVEETAGEGVTPAEVTSSQQIPVTTKPEPIIPASPAPESLSPQTPSDPEPFTPAPTPLMGVADTSASPNQPDPFAVQPKKSKKGLIIIIAVILLIGASVGAYFIWQSLQPASSTQSETPTGGSAPGPADDEDTSGDTEESVTNDATSIEEDVNGLNDSEYEDSTLSDSTLND